MDRSFTHLTWFFDLFGDESAICERDLMRVFGRSNSGTRVTRWIKRSNPKRFSILPAIGLNGLLALTVREGTINRERFENFLEFQLVRWGPRFNNLCRELIIVDN